LVFNNGLGRPGGDYSSVEELVLDVDARGQYARKPGTAYGPDRPVWRYMARNRTDFTARFLSGAQRLPNGDTLICDGVSGTIFEVTPKQQVVWIYTSASAVGSGPGAFAKPGGFPSVGRQRGWNPVFRAHRYGADYAGLAGKDLTPGRIEEGPAPDQPKAKVLSAGFSTVVTPGCSQPSSLRPG
jgi:hypothetical protein